MTASGCDPWHALPITAPVKQPLIPRVLHQICIRDNARVPDVVIEHHQRILAQNLEFTSRVWMNDDIQEAIRLWYGANILRVYRKINPVYGAAKADLFRYLLMYRVGGIYFDLKSGPKLPLSATIRDDDEYLLAWWPEHMRRIGWGNRHEFKDVFGNTEFVQWFIAARPEHPFLAAVIRDVLDNIEHYDNAKFDVGRTGVLRTTGPIAYTLAIHKMIADHPCRKIDLDVSGFEFNAICRTGLEFGVHYGERTEDVVI